MPRGVKVGEREEESGISIDWDKYDYILSFDGAPTIYTPESVAISDYRAVYNVYSNDRTTAIINSVDSSKANEIKLLVISRDFDEDKNCWTGVSQIMEYTTRPDGGSWVIEQYYPYGNNVGIKYKDYKVLYNKYGTIYMG